MTEKADKATPTLGIEKKRKKDSDTVEEALSKDYKKPSKKLKQLKFEPIKKEEGAIITRTTRDNQKTIVPEWSATEAIARIEATLARIIDRQGTAQAGIERLLEIFTREVQELSSDDDVPLKDSKVR